MQDCESCGGFIPGNGDCPNCGARVSRQRSRLLKSAAGGVVAMTLMACYGGPMPVVEPAHPENKGCTPANDQDKDGYCPPEDCDDHDIMVHPRSTDTPNDGVDQNCDGIDGMQPAPGG